MTYVQKHFQHLASKYKYCKKKRLKFDEVGVFYSSDTFFHNTLCTISCGSLTKKLYEDSLLTRHTQDLGDLRAIDGDATH
jgi:hypothetical protein